MTQKRKYYNGRCALYVFIRMKFRVSTPTGSCCLTPYQICSYLQRGLKTEFESFNQKNEIFALKHNLMV